MGFSKKLLSWAPFFFLLWFFWDSPALKPARIYAVLLHELGHAIAAVLTGGEVLQIRVFTSEGGDCSSAGGIRWIVISAGYIGNLVLGYILLRVGIKSKQQGFAVAVLGVATIAVAVLLVRNLVGFAFSSLVGLGFFLCGWKGPEWLNKNLMVFLGLVNVFYPLWDMQSDILMRPGERSDARILAEYLIGDGMPRLVTGLTFGIGCSWLIVGAAIAYAALHEAMGQSRKSLSVK